MRARVELEKKSNKKIEEKGDQLLWRHQTTFSLFEFDKNKRK
jgi:hypothetical protein